MKKIIVILTALIVTLGANAQTKFGVKAGLNVSQISGGTVKGEVSEDIEASGMLVGFHAGAFANFSFSGVIGLQPEVVFSLQGDNDSDANAKTHLNYINVPILLDIKPVPNFSIFVGPQIGINIHRSMTGEGESISGSDLDDILEATGMKINTLDFAAVLGVQYILFDHLTIGARYNFGFTPAIGLTKEVKDAGVSLSGVANRVIQVSLGWSF
jgi:opacity protein-like surface antigen